MGILGDIFAGGAKGTVEGFGELAKDLRTAITGLDPEVQGKLEIIAAKITELQTNVIIAEVQGTGLKANWRPITMLTFVFIIANNYILYPYVSLFWPDAPMLEIPPDMWSLLKIGLGGYVVGRSVEQTVKILKK